MITTPYGHKVYAMAAEYPSAAALYEAAKRVRDAGFRRWDVYSPFPIHGMDDAMGIGKSWLSGWVLFGGISGFLTAVLVEFGPSSFLYPLTVHGKPRGFFTVPAFFDYVRTDSAFRRIFGVFCVANHESLAALEPSDVQLGSLHPRDQ